MEQTSHQNNLRTLFEVENVPKDTQMREIIDGVSSDYFRSIFKDYYARLQRNKSLEQYQVFPNLYYFLIGGSQFFSSKEMCCSQCLTKNHKDGSKTYSHQVLQGGIMHPNKSEVIPFMPEQICNEDVQEKQNCELNGAKRFIAKLRKEFLKIIGGDVLFAKQPFIEQLKLQRMHYT